MGRIKLVYLNDQQRASLKLGSANHIVRRIDKAPPRPSVSHARKELVAHLVSVEVVYRREPLRLTEAENKCPSLGACEGTDRFPYILR